MIAAPLIHTRTFEKDFEPNLKVVPKTFLDSDISWARKNILEATKEIDDLHGVRWVVVDNSRYRIAGVVGFLNVIYSKCKSNGEADKFEELFHDIKNRLVYAFIGVAIDKSKTNDYVPITYDYLWNSFVELIQPIWKRTYQEQIKSEFSSVENFSKPAPNISETYYIGEKELHEANEEFDYNLFVDYLCDQNKSNFSLCTNLSSYNVVKSSPFSVITTSNNNITRLKREPPVSQPVNPASTELSSTTSNTALNKSDSNNGFSKKKLLLLVPSCLLILLIIILAVILGTNQ